jgi:hypothetical protein
MNAESHAAIESLVDRGLRHNERTEDAMEGAVTELRAIEVDIRTTDDAAQKELRKLRGDVDTVNRKDVDAYALALLDKQGAPKAAAKDIRARMKDLELRVIPACDEALWLLRDRTISSLRPDAEERWLLRLKGQLQRWAPPKFIIDPSGVLDAPRAANPAHAERPADIVAWVEHGIERIERFDEEHREEEARKDRQRAAKAAVDNAQAADEREFYRRYEEEERTSARKRHAPAPPYPGFNRWKWLKDHNLLDDYEWVQSGTVVQAQGPASVQSAMNAPPSRDTAEEPESAYTAA